MFRVPGPPPIFAVKTKLSPHQQKRRTENTGHDVDQAGAQKSIENPIAEVGQEDGRTRRWGYLGDECLPGSHVRNVVCRGVT